MLKISTNGTVGKGVTYGKRCCMVVTVSETRLAQVARFVSVIRIKVVTACILLITYLNK